MSRFVTSLLTLCVVFGTSVSVEIVTMDSFLDTLRSNHPVFTKEDLSVEIEKKAKESLLGAEDWMLSAGLTVFRENPEIAIGGPERTDAFSLSAGVNRAFWRTGGRFSASISTGVGKMKLALFDDFPESFHQHRVAVSYTHPLLKNRGGILDRLSYDLKEFDIDVAAIRSRENKEIFLTSVAGDFITLVFLLEQEHIIGERLSLSLDELDRTKRKREANLVDQVDVIRAEDAVTIARETLVLVKSRRKAVQAQLAILAQWDDMNELNPSFDLYEQPMLPPLDAELERLSGASRLLQSIQVRKEQLHVVLDAYEHTRLPDLYLTVEANTKNFDDDFGTSLEMDKYDLLLGLAFTVPLEKREANGLVEKTRLELKQLEYAEREIILDINSSLTNLHVQISELDSVLVLNREQIASAQKRTEEELKLYNQGRGSLTFVLQSRDSEQAARLLYAQNAASLQTLLIQYKSLLDEIL